MSEADAVLIEDDGTASPASVAELPVDWRLPNASFAASNQETNKTSMTWLQGNRNGVGC